MHRTVENFLREQCVALFQSAHWEAEAVLRLLLVKLGYFIIIPFLVRPEELRTGKKEFPAFPEMVHELKEIVSIAQQQQTQHEFITQLGEKIVRAPLQVSCWGLPGHFFLSTVAVQQIFDMIQDVYTRLTRGQNAWHQDLAYTIFHQPDFGGWWIMTSWPFSDAIGASAFFGLEKPVSAYLSSETQQSMEKRQVLLAASILGISHWRSRLMDRAFIYLRIIESLVELGADVNQSWAFVSRDHLWDWEVKKSLWTHFLYHINLLECSPASMRDLFEGTRGYFHLKTTIYKASIVASIKFGACRSVSIPLMVQVAKGRVDMMLEGAISFLDSVTQLSDEDLRSMRKSSESQQLKWEFRLKRCRVALLYSDDWVFTMFHFSRSHGDQVNEKLCELSCALMGFHLFELPRDGKTEHMVDLLHEIRAKKGETDVHTVEASPIFDILDVPAKTQVYCYKQQPGARVRPRLRLNFEESS